MVQESSPRVEKHFPRIAAGVVHLEGNLNLPPQPKGIVIFAHGSGSSRHSPRNQHVASILNQAGWATLLFDLLTPEEEIEDRRDRHLRFDIPFLARRLLEATRWLDTREAVKNLDRAYFGASTGAAAALMAAGQHPRIVKAIVSRGGRPDLADAFLPNVQAATLLIVGGRDTPTIAANRQAMERSRAETELEIVPGATHLFEEPGALDAVARLAENWCARHLGNRE